MNSSIVNSLSENILNYAVKAEAIVVGCDIDNSCHIYSIDNRGIVLCHDDIGFASIGIGSVHSVPFLMQHGYWNGWGYYESLLMTYAAKKQAEVAPGVGKATDMALIGREGTSKLYDGTFLALEKVYPRHIKRMKKTEVRALKEVVDLEKKYIKEHQIPQSEIHQETHHGIR
jgi:hypothetical protein